MGLEVSIRQNVAKVTKAYYTLMSHVFESQVTEQELENQTPKKPVKRPLKSFRWVSLRFFLALGGLAVLVAVSLSFWILNKDPYICSKKERKNVSEQIDPLVQRIDDVNALASSTSRIALVTPLSQMQDVQREIRELDVPKCAEPVKQKLLNSIELLLSAYLGFASGEPDFLVEVKFSLFKNSLDEFTKSYLNMKEGISNYSPELETGQKSEESEAKETEQATKESEAKNYTGAIRRAQQSFRVERGRFAKSVEELEIGIPLETDNFSYKLYNPSNQLSYFTAQSKTTTLRNFLSGVSVKSDGQTSASSCQSLEPSSTPPPAPIFDGHTLQCPEGYEEID